MQNKTLNKEISKRKKIYSLLVATIPIFSIYSAGIPGVNLGELLLILFFIISIFDKKSPTENKNSVVLIITFGYYVLLVTLLSMFFDHSQLNNVLIRTTRFIFYLGVLVFLSKKYFNFRYTISLVKRISILATCFLLLQKILFETYNVFIKGFLPFLPLYTSHYETYDYLSIYKQIFYRPTSFFLEPAHYSQYALLGIVIFLFEKKFDRNNILWAFFLSLGVALSTSGQGLLIGTVIWIIYIFKMVFVIRGSFKMKIIAISTLFSALIALPFILRIGVISNNISRILSRGESTAVSARTEGFVEFFTQESLWIKFFGAGYGNTPYGVWYSSVAYFLYCTGVIGLIMVIFLFAYKYINSKENLNRMIVVLTFLLSMSSEILNNYWIILYFSLIFFRNSYKGLKIANESGVDG